MRCANISICQPALAYNLALIRSHTTARVLAMVKADAYGHGVAAAVPALLSADGFGVACMSEALAVRRVLDELGADRPIVLIEGVFSQDEWQMAIRQGFEMVIHHQAQLDWAYQHTASQENYASTIWLKYNTGMNRLGFDADGTMLAYRRLMSMGYRVILTSHFACADDKDNPVNIQQINAFDKMYRTLQDEFGDRVMGSLCNSAGIFNFTNHHYDWVRAGIGLYGSSPVVGTARSTLGLKNVMTLSSKIMAIHHIKAGEQVGYGGLWTATAPSVIGIVSIGYGDGYPRVVQDGQVLVMTDTPTFCPIVGRVAMDMMAIDLTHLPCATLNTPVVLWGEALDIDRVAKSAGTISYELMCRLTQRPNRQVIAL